MINKSNSQQKSPLLSNSSSLSSPNLQDSPARTFVGGGGGGQNPIQQQQQHNRTAIEVQQIKTNASKNNIQQQRASSTSPLMSLGKQHFSSPHVITSPSPPHSSNHQSYSSQQSISSSHPSVINSKNQMNKSVIKTSSNFGVTSTTHQPPRRSSLPEKLDSKSLPTTTAYTNHDIADLTDLHSQYKKIKDQNEIRQSNTATIQHLKQASIAQSLKEQQQQHAKLQHHPSKKLQQQQQQTPHHFTNVISSPLEKLQHTQPAVGHSNSVTEPKMTWTNISTGNDTRQILHHRTDAKKILPSSFGNDGSSLSPPPRYAFILPP